jgi:metal-dependent HD superfamily phosphatase/phosphodiesterase
MTFYPLVLLRYPMALQFEVPIQGNQTLSTIVDRINSDVELRAYWRASNITAIDRLGFNDHGPTHVKIVARSALKLLRLLMEAGEVPDIVKSYGMRKEDAEAVVVLAAALHDIGHAVHRDNHEEFSVSLAPSVIRRLLDGIYQENEMTIIMVEVLHAMITHRTDLQPLTLEASVVRVGDALDMEKGRARIPFSAGSVNIHSVSALAIDKVRIEKGDERPIRIEICMNNSAGIYQIDQLLRDKIAKTSIRDKMTIVVQVPKEEKRIIEEIKL